jgi:hypothetical protein
MPLQCVSFDTFELYTNNPVKPTADNMSATAATGTNTTAYATTSTAAAGANTAAHVTATAVPANYVGSAGSGGSPSSSPYVMNTKDTKDTKGSPAAGTNKNSAFHMGRARLRHWRAALPQAQSNNLGDAISLSVRTVTRRRTHRRR